MRFMIMVKADKDYEAGLPPKPELLGAIGKLSHDRCQSRGLSRDRRPSSQLQRRPSTGVRWEAQRDRRPICRDKGARWRLRDRSGEVAG
jgi:hypothetical protein